MAWKGNGSDIVNLNSENIKKKFAEKAKQSFKKMIYSTLSLAQWALILLNQFIKKIVALVLLYLLCKKNDLNPLNIYLFTIKKNKTNKNKQIERLQTFLLKDEI